jgi:putative nucleotidyltransferase with HDIG domain
MIYFFPNVTKFNFDVVKNKVWTYENLNAPFDFPIFKSEEEINEERMKRLATIPNFVKKDSSVYAENFQGIADIDFEALDLSEFQSFQLKQSLTIVLDSLQRKGIISTSFKLPRDNKLIYLVEGNTYRPIQLTEFLSLDKVKSELSKHLESNFLNVDKVLPTLVFKGLKENIIVDDVYFQLKRNEILDQISPTKGMVKKGTEIIAKGEQIGPLQYEQLKSLQKNYIYHENDAKDSFVVWAGYTLLVALALLMLLLFIQQYRPHIYENNSQMGFIFFNVLLIYFFTILVIKINPTYLFIVPVCILPITLKAFFDARLGLFTHVITILILGLIVSNSYEYMFLQFIAGIVTILTVSELYKRANLFVSVGKITLVYVVSYMAFHLIQEANVQSINYQNLLYFVLSGIGLLFVQPLIYMFERIFGLVSDLSLLELSDTNSPLLKKLAEVAPGTFHHSLNVANLAEASANEVNANTLLVRVGALYHDIGKMDNPFYFTENQMTSVNPHDEITPLESAKIIIEHRSKGIEIAKKNGLPDRIIDFIRTHHGTTKVYYFFIKEKELNPDEINSSDFIYPGPLPFSKETAILMMCDSVEAASKSLREPTAKVIDQFVEKIIQKQIDEQQFINADITFKDRKSVV